MAGVFKPYWPPAGGQYDKIGEALEQAFAQIAEDQQVPLELVRLLALYQAGSLRKLKRALILYLYQSGKSYQEIAEETGLQVSTVRQYLWELRAEGMLEPSIRKGRQLLPPEEIQRRQEIVPSMVRQCATLREIGEALAITREGARQVVRKLKARLGEDVFQPDEPRYTLHEASKLTGVSGGSFKRLLESQGVVLRRRGKKVYQLDQSQIKLVRRLLKKKLDKTCQICGRRFYLKRGKRGRIRKICYRKDCRSFASRERRRRMLERPAAESSNPRMRELAAALKPPGKRGERWVTLRRACRIAGITPSQLEWLFLRRVVATRPHPTKRALKTGRPVRLFPVSQLEVVKQVYQKYRKVG